MLKRLLLLALLLIGSLYAYDTRLDAYPSAKANYERANKGDADAAYNLAMFYDEKINDNDKAIEWYKTADALGASHAAYNLGYVFEKELHNNETALTWYLKAANSGDTKAPFALGLLYKNHYQNYQKAIEWYKQSYHIGNVEGATNLGYLYYVTLKDTNQGIKWYSLAAQEGDSDAIKNLGNLYHDQGDNIKGAAYIFAMVNYGYSKEEVLSFLKNDWKLDRDTLQKAYELQQTLDIPKHYTGGID